MINNRQTKYGKDYSQQTETRHKQEALLILLR